MSESSIDKVLASRRASTTAPGPSDENEADKFFSILVGEPVQEQFLELRFRVGMRTCVAYGDLSWFNYDPDSGTLDLEFGVFMVTIKGRGLGGRVFDGIKQKRVGWLQEASAELQDHKGNDTYIEAITISVPGSESAGEAVAA